MYAPSHSLRSNANAIAWALLSQTIWLPLLAINIYDQWQASVSDLTPPTADAIPQTSGSVAAAGSASSHPQSVVSPPAPVLASASTPEDPLVNGALSRSIETSTPAALPTLSMAPRRWTLQDSRLAPLPAFEPPAAQPLEPLTPPVEVRQSKDPVLRRFSPSELLGGPLTLDDLNAPLMPAAAQAERAHWASSGDPLAPLPEPLREPMREALRTLPEPGTVVEPARVVHVPSRSVTTTTTVPLALQSDGSVDVLTRPDNKGVLEEIDHWSRQQKAPARGSMSPAVLQLHPLEEALPAPSKVSAAPSTVAMPASTAAPTTTRDRRPLQAEELDYWSNQAPASAPSP